MLMRNFQLLRYFIRKVATARPQKREPVKFTEQQLSQMGPGLNSIRKSIPEAFKQKYEQRMSEQKGQNEDEEKPQAKRKVKKTILDRQRELYNKQMPKPLAQEQRLTLQEMGLAELSSVRLGPQYLPVSYLKQAQKIFHKYGQTRLREIADNFSKYLSFRYREEKIDYDKYQDLKFERLEQKLPKEKQVQQIYLIGEQKVYDTKLRQDQTVRKVDDQPISMQVSYTQNIAVSYLLNRAPRTFSTAIRLMTEIKYKYPTFKPQSFLDFGSGLSAGSCAFVDIFGNTGQVYNVEPAAKMRKLSKYLTEGMGIRHYQSLGEMSTEVKQADIVYAGYVINELKPDLVEVYLQALYAKTKNQGFLVLVEYGSPFGARLINSARKWAIEKGMYIAAPCPHHMKCPLTKSKSWCHFEQSSGIYPQNVFGKLPTTQAVQYEKYSYLILQKKENTSQLLPTQKHDPNVTSEWERIIFPTMKKGRHIVFDICTKQGSFERRVSAASHGLEYKELKKLKWGDYWRFGKRIPHRYRKERRTGLRLW